MNSKVKKIVGFSAIGAITAGMVVANALCAYWKTPITNFLCGTGDSFSGENVEQTLAKGDALCHKIAEDSIVLLKNENDALPLSEDVKTLNLFGYGATDNGFLLKGVGSGSSTISANNKVSLLTALRDAGYSCNEEIMNIYNTSSNYTGSTRPSSPSSGNVYNLAEPRISLFTDDIMKRAAENSDVGIFVISRDGGENVGEIPAGYLDITAEEQAMLNLMDQYFGKVIVILNTTNTMHTGFLANATVDAAFYVGLLGQSGTRAIPSVLSGKTKDADGNAIEYSPSGHLADTMVYSPDYDPSYANRAVSNKSIQYVDDIYFGYKWYETADAEGYFKNVDNSYGKGYEGVVQYPFGYGLSYTNFAWSHVSVEANGKAIGNTLPSDPKTEITVKVFVENTGDHEGKDVVGLYYTPPYVKGEIEKAEVNLLDFAKTETLPSGKGQYLTMTFTPYDLASYDCYDKNKNGHTGYELDEGTYTLTLRTDAHTIAEGDGMQIELKLSSPVNIDKDPVTDETVENRFTGATAYANVPIDASTVGGEKQYMTRADFAATFPKKQAQQPTNTAAVDNAASFYNTVYDGATMPTQESGGELRLLKTNDGANATKNQLLGTDKSVTLQADMELFKELTDYDSAKWDELLNQMSIEEMFELVDCGGFHTSAVESIGKPIRFDYDGPAGFNANSQTGDWSGDKPTNSDGAWTAYPSESLIGCSWNKDLLKEMGLSMGSEAEISHLSGWYAPGVNLHRSAYTARNYEYYSEDGVLSGKLAAKLIYGAKVNNLYCYIKHFCVSEPGPNPGRVNTWLTEQNLRENYLKPFELAVKEGSANAVMTAFNRVGAVWAGANYAMNVSILRNEWGFRGSVISDWASDLGESGMNVNQGVRGGNDLWLKPNRNNNLSKNNTADVTAARVASKNILYTFVDTYYFAQTVDSSERAGHSVNLGFTFKENVFAWWIPVLVGVDVLVAAGLGFWGFRLIKPKKKDVA